MNDNPSGASGDESPAIQDSIVRINGECRHSESGVHSPAPWGAEGILQAKDSLVRVDGGIRNEVHHHHAPQAVYCPCCHTQVHPNETSARCPECGVYPVHDRCMDRHLLICAACANRYAKEERLRESAGRVCARLEGRDNRRACFLFAKRTIQWGRGKQDQLPPLRPKGEAPYSVGSNDAVLRVYSITPSGVPGEDKDRSRIISRIHGALSVRRTCGGEEEVFVIDWGMDGQGSAYGTWLGQKCLAPGMWHSCPDTSRLVLGKDVSSRLEGLPLRVRAFRNRANPAQIDAVVVNREDALGDSGHTYVIVVRSAAVGLGPECPLSFGNLLGQDSMAWGCVRAVNGSWVYARAGEGVPAPAACTSPDGILPLEAPTALQIGEFQMTLSPVEDGDFCKS